MNNQKRMDEIASQFGDSGKINMFLGREKIYPNKEVSDATVERLENALRSPQSEKGVVKVLEFTGETNKVELIYRSSQGELNFDPRNITSKFQSNSLEQKPETSSLQQAVKPPTEKEVLPKEQSPTFENKTNTNNPGLDELSSSASFDSRSGRQIFSVPINSNQPKLDEKMQKVPDTVEVETNGISSLNEPQPHRPPRQIFSVPLNPTPLQLDEKMPAVVSPNNVTNQGSLEQALASANARIDALQTQLKDTQKSLEDLSKFVRNDNLKSWAENKVTGITNTSQSIAEQAKSKVMQWVQTKTTAVKEAVNQKVNEVKTVAQDKVNEVKTAAQDKVNEVKTATQDKVNEVKTVAQDKAREVKTTAQNKVNEVKEAVQLKGIEIKESVREQANKFLAPVNSQEVEQAAKYVVRAYGDGKSYNKAATHSFQLNDKNELSVARQSDGAVIYQKGELTKAANSHDILKLNALPAVVNQIKVTQMQSAPKQGMEVGR